MSTVNKGLIGALILQVFILLGMTMFSSNEALQPSGSIELFPDLESEKVTSVEIYGPSADGDGQENIRLKRKGDNWVIADADDFPAKKTEIERLIGTLAGLKSRNQVLTGSTYHSKLEVAEDKYRRKITLSADGKDHVLFLGTSPRFKTIHVRKDGENPVYQVDELSESDAGARAWSWVDRTYVKYPKDQIWALTLENEHGKIQLDRDPSSNTWAALGVEKELDSTAVDGLVNDAREIGLESPVGKTEKPEYELGKSAALTLVTGTSTTAGVPPKTTKTIKVKIGKEIAGKNRRYVKASTSEYVIEAAGWELKKLVETKGEDLIKKEEEKKDDK